MDHLLNFVYTVLGYGVLLFAIAGIFYVVDRLANNEEATMHFEIYRLPGTLRWSWRLRADNNEVIARGDCYDNKEDCFRAVSLVQDARLTTPIQWLDT